MVTMKCQQNLGINSVKVAGNKIVSCDKTIRIWDLASGKQTALCTGHTTSVISVKVVGNKIVSWSADNTVRIGDISILNRLRTMNRKQTDAIYAYLKTAHGNNTKDHWQEIENLLNTSVEEEVINSSNCYLIN